MILGPLGFLQHCFADQVLEEEVLYLRQCSYPSPGNNISRPLAKISTAIAASSSPMMRIEKILPRPARCRAIITVACVSCERSREVSSGACASSRPRIIVFK